MTQETAQSRQAWVDIARGGAIFFVVFYHSTLFLASVEAWSTPALLVSGLLRSLPIPLFLFVSGFLVAGAVHRSRAESLLRVWAWVWLYLVWSLINFAVFSFVPWYRTNHPADSWWDLGGILVWPNNGLWYLYALPVFFLLCRLTRRLPAAVVVAAAAVLSVLFMSHVLVTGNFAFDDMGSYFVVFAVGARLRDGVVAGVARLTGLRALLAVGVYAVLVVADLLAVLLAGVDPLALSAVPVLGTLEVAAAVVAGLAASRLLAPTALGRLLEWLGRRTLQVYVPHEILIGVLVAALGPQLAATGGPTRHALPFLLAVVGITLALLLHRALRRVPWLYAPPLPASVARRSSALPSRASR